MMATVVDIVNVALTMLGESHIVDLTDNSKVAREATFVYAQTRDAVLSGYDWSFSKARASLPALTEAPAFQYKFKYPLPADCLRLIYVGEHYVGIDLSDYRTGPTERFTIEGRDILTNDGFPLNIRYIRRVEDSTLFSATFDDALSAKLAYRLAEALTQSNAKINHAKDAFNEAIRIAIRVNAIELPPQHLADDEWLISRL